MKRILSVLLSIVMVISLCACASKENQAPAADTAVESVVENKLPEKDIKILFTNDVHCAIDSNIGYSGVSEIKNALQSDGSTVLLVDVGDFSQGGNIGTLTNGEKIVDIMNEMGYTIATIGNHDFDFGVEQMMSNVARANFPIVCCNFMDVEGNQIFDSYKIIEVNGCKIAFVGILTPETITCANPKYFQDENGKTLYTFCEDVTGDTLYNAVQQGVDAAIAEGADYVVALAHLGNAAQSSPWTSSDVITHTTGIDVVLDGHSHAVYEKEVVKNAEGKDVLLSQTGTKLENVGYLCIKTDGTFDIKLINDSGIEEYINEIEKEFEETLNKVVAHTDVDLTIKDPKTGLRMVRQNETNIGDLVADAYKAALGTDVAIANGGSIRDSIPAGDITYGQILTVHPFNNNMCSCEASGQNILDALEMGVSALPGEDPKFLNVSGITYTVDMSVDSHVTTDSMGNFVSVDGDRRVKDVMINGEPVDPDRIYTIACSAYYLRDGGDGMIMFKDNNMILLEGPLDNQVLIDYIVNNLGGVVGEEYSNVYGQGRIKIING